MSTGTPEQLALSVDFPPSTPSPGSAWWDRIEPARLLPKTAQEGEREIPARYHRDGLYSTVDPETPLWRQVLRSIKDPCSPSVFAVSQGGKWCLEYIVLENRTLTTRLLALLVKHRPQDTCLRYHLQRSSGIQVPNNQIQP